MKNRKKFFSSLLAAVMFFSAVTINAVAAAPMADYGDNADVLLLDDTASEPTASGECGSDVTWVLDNGVLTISGTGDMEDDNYLDYPFSFYKNSIKSVIIENGVTSICDYAFNDFSYLTSVDISDSVTSIGEYAFSWCKSLTSIDIPDSVTSIDEYAFSWCKSLTSIKIPDSVTSIAANAFISYPKNFVIKGYTGSFAELYANTNSLKFESIGESDVKFALNGECGKDGNNLTWTFDSNGMLTISGTGDMADYKYYKAPWAKYSYYIKSAAIENGVTSVGNYAFRDCRNLTSIKISDSVTSIGTEAFHGCDSLTSVDIPDYVTSIGDYSFAGCDSLTSIKIPNSVTSIGEGAFYGCYNLIIKGYAGSYAQTYADEHSTDEYNTIFMDIVTKFIENGECGDNLTWTLTEDTLTISGTGDMVNYDHLGFAPWYKYRAYIKSAVIENGVTSIGDYAFCNQYSLTSVDIPDSVTYIGNHAFDYCRHLTSVDIPDSVTSIGSYAFSSCFDLISVDIPDSVTYIGEDAFNDCYALTSVDIPDSVTYIGSYAFDDCSSLTDIFVNDNNQNYNDIDGVLFNKDNSVLIKHPQGKSNTSYFVPNSVTYISDSAFHDCENLTSIDIPNSVNSIGNLAFRCCCNLASVGIPDSVTYIGDFAVDGCDKLVIKGYTGSFADLYANVNNIVFESIGESDVKFTLNGSFGKDGDNLTWTFDSNGMLTISGTGDMADYSYPSHAPWFKYSYYIKSAEIEYGVTSIGENVFDKCENLTSITIPDSITSICSLAFSWCESLTSIDIPDSVTSIGNLAFYGCESLTNVDIPDSVTYIGDFAFYSCESLTNIFVDKNNQYYNDINGVLFNKDNSIIIKYPQEKSDTSYSLPNSITSIGNDAFSGCSALTSIDIPDSVAYIGNQAFEDCNSLTNINIPDLVTSIEYRAFSYCSSLTSINIPNSVNSIDEYAFQNCFDLTYINIPDSVTSIGNHAFDGCDKLVIKGYTGSYAETYTNENNIEFESIGNAPSAEPTTAPSAEPTTEPTTTPATEPSIEPTTTATQPTETPTPIIPTETEAPVCDDFADKVTVDFKVDKDGKAELNIETKHQDESEKIQTTAYVTYFDSRGRLTGVKILTPNENGDYSFDINSGNYKIMLWDDFKPIIKALTQLN